MRTQTAILLGSATAAVASCAPVNCTKAALATLDAEIVSADFYPSGKNISLPNQVPSCGGPSYSPRVTADVCRVVVNVATSGSSVVRVEAWLPADEDAWNGRFLATGNGGIGGCIDYRTMQAGAQLQFAAFGTNAGHDGETGHDFFLGHPEIINDFGHRGIHVEAEAGKSIIEAYYGRPQTKSYYQACSTGGRQGFQTAHLYPEDFDGMLLGAPAVDWLHIVASKAILARRIGWPDFESSGYVRPEQWTAIVKKQIELYDGLDGVTDGIIDDPASIRFDPQLLACGTGLLDDELCLKPAQVLSVRAAYQPLTDTEGNIVYPSFEIGSNTNVFSENQVNGTELQYRVLDDFWRGAVYNDSSWTSHNFTKEDMDFAVNLNPGGVGFHDPDLSEFHARGSKIIAYHGRTDQTITSLLASEYFAQIQAALDLSVDEMLEFYRLFLIPGHGHCGGGVGAWNIGQAYPFDEENLDEVHNALLALVAWVEEGRAPEGIVGTKYTSDDVTKPVLAQRTHCPYPYKSIWDGEGDAKEATSWTCGIA